MKHNRGGRSDLVTIGKIVKSNAHTDYVCQIYAPGEVEEPPSPADYAFGSFVRIPLRQGGGDLVGLIYDTVLLNPDFGNLGPRLSPAPDLAVFSPDYLTEKMTVVGITAVGVLAPDDIANHGVPPEVAQADTLVQRMDEDAVRAFHCPDNDGEVCLGYTPLLLALDSPLARLLLLQVIDQLTELFPERSACLSVLRGEMAWQAKVRTVGGRS
jgi:hypothetical protein